MAIGNFKVGDRVCVRDSDLALCGNVREMDEGGNVVLVDETNAEWSFQSGDLDSFQTEVCGHLLDFYRTNETLRYLAKPRVTGYKFSLGNGYLAEQYREENELIKNTAKSLGCPSALFTSKEDINKARAREYVTGAYSNRGSEMCAKYDCASVIRGYNEAFKMNPLKTSR